jgi:hypothetical protein
VCCDDSSLRASSAFVAGSLATFLATLVVVHEAKSPHCAGACAHPAGASAGPPACASAKCNSASLTIQTRSGSSARSSLASVRSIRLQHRGGQHRAAVVVRAFRLSPDAHAPARAALAFTPSYYGTSADVRALAEI